MDRLLLNEFKLDILPPLICRVSEKLGMWLDTESSFFIERLAQVEKVHAFGLSASLKADYKDGFMRAGFRDLYPEDLRTFLPVKLIGQKRSF